MKFSLMLAVGSWGGIYIRRGWSKGICLGWIAITFLPDDIEEVLNDLVNKLKAYEGGGKQTIVADV